MKKYHVYQIDAFTRNKLQGNPAGVISNADGLTDDQMQAIASELNNSETAFILNATDSDHDVWVRFFTPKVEVPTCGHATISAHYVRAMENNLKSCTVYQRIGIGILPVDIIKEETDFHIVMTQGTPEIFPPIINKKHDDILKALKLVPSNLDDRCPIQIASTGHSKVMIGIKSREVLNTLTPDFTRLSEISREIECNGYFVFTFDSDTEDILTHGRMFAPAIGINEDPVTGNANGPLGAYLIHHKILNISEGIITFKGKQGEAIGRPGIVSVTVEVEDSQPVKVQVGGDATVAFKTEIEI